MSELYRYLVVSECYHSGYVLGYYPTMEAAEKIMDEHVAKYEFKQKSETYERLFEMIIGYSTYKVHPSRKYHYLRAHEKGATNGIYSIFILDTKMPGFSLDKFKRERASNVCVFETDEFDPEEHKFISILAN